MPRILDNTPCHFGHQFNKPTNTLHYKTSFPDKKVAFTQTLFFLLALINLNIMLRAGKKKSRKKKHKKE